MSKLSLLEPLVFRQAGHRQGQTDRGCRRGIEPERKAQDDPRRDIKGDGDPGATHGLAQNLVDHHDVDERMVDLDNRQCLRACVE